MYGCSKLSSCSEELQGHVIITALFLSCGMVNTKNYVSNFRKVVNEKRQTKFIYLFWVVSLLLKSGKKKNTNKKGLYRYIYFISDQIQIL